MAEQTTVARPYAEAVFTLAQSENALPVWSEMLRFAAEIEGDRGLRATLENPKLSGADKEALFLSICGDRLNASGRKFIRVLIESGRIELLPEIRSLFEELKDSAEGVARAEITSAFDLGQEELARLTRGLERRFGRRVETTVTIDRDLIGGARIIVGDTVIDGSVQAELASMAQQLRA